MSTKAGTVQRRAATASLATAAIALGLGVGVASAPANAEDATTPAKLFGRHWGTITYVYRVPRKSGPENAIGTPSTYSLLDGKTTVTAYPLEFGQSIPQGNESDYHEVHWDKFTPVDRYATWDGTESTRVDRWKENAKKIRWILAHSAPQQEAASVLQEAGIKGVAAEKAFDKVRDATGSAIWNLTSGAELFAIDGATMFDPDTPINENNSQVFALYQWLLNNAADSAPPPKPAVTFNATDTSGISSTILPRVRLDTTSDKTTIKAALPEGVALKLTEPTAGGKTESYTDKVDVKVSAPGAFDLSLKVEAGTEPRNVEVTATADVPAMPVGSVWSQP